MYLIFIQCWKKKKDKINIKEKSRKACSGADLLWISLPTPFVLCYLRLSFLSVGRSVCLSMCFFLLFSISDLFLNILLLVLQKVFCRMLLVLFCYVNVTCFELSKGHLLLLSSALLDKGRGGEINNSLEITCICLCFLPVPLFLWIYLGLLTIFSSRVRLISTNPFSPQKIRHIRCLRLSWRIILC